MNARAVSYETLLGPEAFLRVEFQKRAGRILGFVIQLECLINEEWYPVIRYDTAHGFAYCDILHPTKEAQKIALNLSDYGSALAFARNDVAERWGYYCERFAKWLKEKPNSQKTKS